MLPSSVAKTWLCQGLVNTDSVDWVETGAGGVRRKMIERPRKCLWSMMIVDGWMVVAHDGDDGRSDYEMCWRFLWNTVWLYDVEVRSAVWGCLWSTSQALRQGYTWLIIFNYFGRRIEESCRYIQTIHITHITWKSNIFLEAATFGHGPLLVRLKTIILLASQYKETMHSSCVEFSLWVSRG